MNVQTVLAIIGICGLWLGSSLPASAFDTDPRCAKSKYPVRCTCALQNGGWIDGYTPEGRPRWRVNRPLSPNQISIGNPGNDNCVNSNGGEIIH